MKNYIQKGDAITVPAPAAVVSGEGVLVGDLFGVASGDAANGSTVTLATVGVFELPKTSTDDIAVGVAIYWDDSAGEATATSTDNTLIGHAVASAGNPSATVKVRLSV
ncbi:MAG: capsid cement protein [Pseudomonadota bacterium]